MRAEAAGAAGHGDPPAGGGQAVPRGQGEAGAGGGEAAGPGRQRLHEVRLQARLLEAGT